MLFLEWYEDSPKKPVAQRLTDAAAAYRVRFAAAPTLILVNAADAGSVLAGCEVKQDRRVRKDCYQVGRVDP
jgi:hypothetical protein